MSHAVKCDCCKQCTPEINPRYSFKKRWVWIKRHYDSQGGWEQELDICESCWNKLSEIKGE